MGPCARARSESAPASYGKWVPKVQRIAVAAVLFVTMVVGVAAGAAECTIKIVALGDSLSAGYQLSVSEAFPAQLERALKAKGIAVDIANACPTSGGISTPVKRRGMTRFPITRDVQCVP